VEKLDLEVGAGRDPAWDFAGFIQSRNPAFFPICGI